ncbi:FAD/NAD(P)-binding domain-containing protein [Aaosphaeria arxii CBS 175.79]|uniref:FAD/NAD(P)-binding domain-containing protein n=1 Tax=Aaosphaeria arxii CBS 175.79 TaxID=1450172 RepID=A0A6A5XZ16_9PLEO|nr:FAD/NAD(P)-binding domain-containing protein [Aaosphaeria arxii CBS 175.79]KAF2018538.1 FAD/NAD(P)-binding domain-containing protein [Aaosphaeria arxii CBS 175.79]
MTYLFAWWCLIQFSSLWQMGEAWPLTLRHEKKHEKPPVCIIGAGPAGLTAASKLEAKGVKAIIFDKQPDIGGKCQSWYDDQGIFHPLGAAFFSNGTYPETVKVINASGVSVEPFALAGARQQFQFNYTTESGDIKPAPGITVPMIARLGEEIPRYIQTWQRRFAPFSAPSFKNGVPDEFSVTGTEWFVANNFTTLQQLLVNPLALYGYGDINIVPALYVLQYITPDLLTAFLGRSSVYYADFHKIWVEWAKGALCKTEIRTSHEIRCIDRSGENPVLKYTKPHGKFYEWGHQECSSLIFALPPTIENLERAGLDITEKENEIFSAVVTHNYFSSAVEIDMPFGVSYIAASANSTIPPPNDGQPVAVLRLSAESNVSVAWSWGPDGEFPESMGYDLVLDTFGKLNKDPRNETAQPQPFCPDNVKAFRKWDYFPHFGSQALKDDIYARMTKLQGCKKTFWASGLGGMETVEWAIRAGQDVVDTHF